MLQRDHQNKPNCVIDYSQTGFNWAE